jgi:hypothetical protein
VDASVYEEHAEAKDLSETLVYNTESIRRRNQEQEREGGVNPAFLMLDRKYSTVTSTDGRDAQCFCDSLCSS